MKKFITILLVAMAASVQQTSAQQSLVDTQRDAVKQSHKVVQFGSGELDPTQYNDSIRHLIDMFYYDQFRHFSDPEAPYFLFMSRDSSLAMGIGGAVRMRGYYDWDGAMPGAAFAPYFISMTPDPTKMRHFDTTPSGTCLFFRVLGRNKAIGHYQLYIEANFTGYQSRDLKLKKAYAIVNDFTIGYANSTFSDPAAQPPIIDAQGPSNKISGTNVLVRYMPRLTKHWIVAVSAETPVNPGVTYTSTTKAVDNPVPDGAAFVQYEWGPTSHVRLSGVVRSLSWRDTEAARNHHTPGWGVMLSSVAHPVAPLTTYATINYGRGYAGLGGDLSMGNYDLVPDPDNQSQLYAPASLGWCLGLQWNFRPNLFMSASTSATHYMPRSGAAPDEYRRGLMASVNAYWNLTARIQLGAEFDFGRRVNIGGAHHNACRANIMAQFSF